MWSSNGIWNIILLALGVGLAILSFGVFRSTDTVLTNLAGSENRLANNDRSFGTASFEGAKLSYTDEQGNVSEFQGKDQIQDFCIDVLGDKRE